MAPVQLWSCPGSPQAGEVQPGHSSVSNCFQMWDFFCSQVCVHTHIYVHLNLFWAGRFDKLVSLSIRVSYLLVLVPPSSTDRTRQVSPHLGGGTKIWSRIFFFFFRNSFCSVYIAVCPVGTKCSFNISHWIFQTGTIFRAVKVEKYIFPPIYIFIYRSTCTHIITSLPHAHI